MSDATQPVSAVEEEVEVCLGCGAATDARDCGCPAGTAMVRRSIKEQKKPLFIPLNGEYFDAFVDGTKVDELRRYGPRWNERTCVVGRPVLLSRGYGRSRRLTGRVVRFKKQHGSTFGSTYKASILRLFGALDLYIACIGIELNHGV